MTQASKICAALFVLCLLAVLGVLRVQTFRAERHYFGLLHAGRHEDFPQVIREYHGLPEDYRGRPHVATYYNDAKMAVGDLTSSGWIPPVERLDVILFGVLVAGVIIFVMTIPIKTQLKRTREEAAPPDLPTAGQIEFIRRINRGVVPVGLTRESAAAMIKRHLAIVSSTPKVTRVDFTPGEFMSGSRSYREKMKLERERKRAQEKLLRQQQQEQRRQERDALNAQKAVDRLYSKRIAEEGKLIKARDEVQGGSRKPRSEKAQTIQEFQNLVNDILADKKIEPQEVRQFKAWLIANKKTPDDFAPMLKMIDESLVDGTIDEAEAQTIYEGVIDCLITLRERCAS